VSVAVQKERRLKEIIAVYLRTLRKNSGVLLDLQRQAKNSIEYCREKGFDEPKFARRVLEACDQQLTYITCREAEIRALREGKEKGQMSLRPMEGDTTGRHPTQGNTGGKHPGEGNTLGCISACAESEYDSSTAIAEEVPAFPVEEGVPDPNRVVGVGVSRHPPTYPTPFQREREERGEE